MALAPFFGPLSANDPSLHGLSKLEALSSIRNRIRLLIKELAPPRPTAPPPHDPLCQETGPWLWLGVGDRMHAARWYQTCVTCEPVELRFLTDPVDASLVTGNAALGVLFDVYQEVRSCPDDEEEDSSKALTNTHDEDDSGGSDSGKGEESGTESSEGSGGSSGGGNVGEQSSPNRPNETSTSACVIAPGLVLQEVREAPKQMVGADGESSGLDSEAQPAPFPMPSPLQEWFD